MYFSDFFGGAEQVRRLRHLSSRRPAALRRSVGS